MNLPARLFSGALFCALGIFSWACEEPGEIDLSDNPTDNIELVIRDLPLEASQVILDSVHTNASNRMILGRIQDDVFGEVFSNSYVQFGLRSSGNPTISQQAVYDSLRLFITLSGSQGLNFTAEQRYTVYELDDDLKLDVEYYGNSSLPFKADPLGEYLGTVIPGVDSILTIPMPDALGQDFFNKVQSGDAVILSNHAFKDYFKGIYVEAGAENDALHLFDLTNNRMRLSIFFHTETDTLEYFFTTTGNTHFNTLQQDRTGSILEGVPGPRVDFEPGTGSYYTHAGLGNLTKLDFSGVKTFLDSLGVFKLNLAELEIIPKDPQNQFIPLPNTVLFYYANEENNLLVDGAQVGAIQVDGFNQNGTGSNLIASYDAETNRYKASITGYLQALSDGSLPYSSVFVIPSGVGATLNQMEVPIEDFRLKVYYTLISENQN
jgi:hypothetical protein